MMRLSPREIDHLLSEAYRTPRDLNPLQVTSKDLTVFLDMFAVPYRSRWGRDGAKGLKDLKEEIQQAESAMVLQHPLIGGVSLKEAVLMRAFRTVSVRITHQTPNPTPLNPGQVRSEVLREYRRQPDGTLRNRRFPNPSEKLKWSDQGPMHAVWRLLKEELGLRLTFKRFQEEIAPRLTFVPSEVRAFEDYCAGRKTELDIHPSESYPGLWSHNEVWHYVLELPDGFYEPEGYEETRTKNIFLWEPTEPGAHD